MPEVTQLDRIEARQARIEQKIDTIIALARAQLSEEFLMATNLDTLTARVTELETVDESAIALIKGLADEIRSTAPDRAALDALADRIGSASTALAAAVTANTPTNG